MSASLVSSDSDMLSTTTVILPDCPLSTGPALTAALTSPAWKAPAAPAGQPGVAGGGVAL